MAGKTGRTVKTTLPALALTAAVLCAGIGLTPALSLAEEAGKPSSEKAKHAAPNNKSEPASSTAPQGETEEVTQAKAEYPPAVARLQSFIDRLRTLEADFIQRIEKVDAATPKESMGHFSASKPGMFRWDYRAPFEQLIVSDGKTVWYYEPDLLQATRADASRLNETPAAFLVSGGRIDRLFSWKVTEGDETTPPEVRLSPLKESAFQEIVVTLHPTRDELVGLVVEDTLGHRSFFTFTEMRFNQALSLDRFQFQPPDDVDVIDG